MEILCATMAMRGFSFLSRVSIPEAIKGHAIGNVTQYLANRFNASHLQEYGKGFPCGFGLLWCI